MRCVPAATDPGGTGGADSHLHTQNVAGTHTHTLATTTHSHASDDAGAHNHGTGDGDAQNYDRGARVTQGLHHHQINNQGSHTHTAATPGNHSHTVNTSDGRPPFYELAPIDADAGGADQEIGLICIWTGTLGNIPAGWELCDGTGLGPDLTGRYIRGVNTGGTNPGNTGGNLTHTHTVDGAGNHGHTMNNTGAHTHAAALSNSAWSHWHGAESVYQTPATYRMGIVYFGPSHNHGDLSNTGAHLDHTATASGNHADHTYGNGSSLPVYYEVAYIYLNTPPAPGGGGAGAVVMGDALIKTLILEGIID